MSTPQTRMRVAGRGQPSILSGSLATEGATLRLSVRATCRKLGFARSTYYYRPSAPPATIEFEHRLVARMVHLHRNFPRDGYRRMTLRLQSEDLLVNRKRVARLMQAHGLLARAPQSATRQLDSEGNSWIHPDLYHKVRITSPLQAWVVDVAYLTLECGLIYLAAVIDAYDRKIVGYAISRQISYRLARMALHAAIQRHSPPAGLIHHSSCGSPYTTREYRHLLNRYDLRASVGYPIVAPNGESVACAKASFRHIDMKLPAYRSYDEAAQRVSQFVRNVYDRVQCDRVLMQRPLLEWPKCQSR